MGIKFGAITELATGLLASHKVAYTTGTLTRLLRLDTLADWILQTYAGFTQSGSGASSRTSQAKLREWVSTGDFPTPQEALDSLASGGTLLVTSYHTLTSALNVTVNDIHIFGMGKDTGFNSDTADVNVITAASVSGLRISNLRINANGSSTGDALGNCILATTVTDSMFENLWLENARNGIYIRTNSARITCQGLNAQNMVGQYGVLITGSNDVAIANSVYRSNSTTMQEGIQTNIEGATRCKRINVTNCTIDLSSASSTGQVGISFRYTDGGSISGNTVALSTGAEATASRICYVVNNSTAISVGNNFGTGGQASQPTNISEGINVGDGSTDVAVVGNVLDTTTAGIHFACLRGAISGNHIRSTRDGSGILVDAGSLSTAAVTVSGNTIHTTTGSNAPGIIIEKLRGVSVTGNVVRNSDHMGIRVLDSEDVVVSGNLVSGADSVGIDVNGSPRTTIVGNHVSDNNEDNTASLGGIQLTSSDDCVISGNVSGNTGGTGNQKYGVNVANAACDRTLIVNNNVQSNATAGINDSGTSTIKRQNIGFLTETSGSDSIASGTTTKAVTFSTALAVTPTAANISISFTEQGTSDYGRFWLTTISNSGFTLNVSADPGASNLDFSYQVIAL